MAQDEPGPEPDAAPVSLHIARLELPSEIRGSHLALAEGGVKATLDGQGDLSATAFTTKGIPGRMPAVGAALSWRRAGLPLGLRAGWIGERRTKQGVVLYSSVPAELAPSGRQMDISGQWHRPLAQGQLRLGTVLSLRPGHRQDADPELTFLAGWRWDF